MANKLMIITEILARLAEAKLSFSIAGDFERAGNTRMYDSLLDNSQNEQNIADLLTLALLAQPDRSDTPAQPAKSASARLVVRESAMASVGRSGAPKSNATGKPVSIAITADKQPVLQPVSFGGSLDTELGLAESLNFLNSVQLASGGAWLDDAQGQEWRNG